MKFRVSPSNLESFRNYLIGNYALWGKAQADLKAELLGGFSGNPSTSLGTAVHAIIEGQPYEYTGTEIRYHDAQMGLTWSFTGQAQEMILALRDHFTTAMHEVPIKANVKLFDGTEVEMNMRIDALDGLMITDFKTSKTKKAYSDFAHSIQWRCYCFALPEVNEVSYVVLEFKHNDPDKVQDQVKVRYFNYLPEQNNDAKVVDLMQAFIDWVKDDAELYEHFVQYEGEQRDAYITRCAFLFPELIQKVYAGSETKDRAEQIIRHRVKKYPELQPWAESLLQELRELK